VSAGRLVVAVLLAVLALAGTARADFFSISFLGGDEQPRRQAQAQVTVTGDVRAEFRSDPATCAAVGRCGLTGTVVWRPGRGGVLFAFAYGPEVDEPLQALLSLGADPLDDTGPETVAEVRRTTPDGSRLCVDRVRDTGIFGWTGPAGGVEATLGPERDGTDILATTCAGPVAADALAALGRRRVARVQVLGGRTTIDLAGEGPLTTPGLTGSVRSTVRLVVGAMRRGRRATQVRDRRRSIEARYTVERVAGRVDVDLAGAAEGVRCATLDACGAAGTATLVPDGASGVVSLVASGRRALGRGPLLAALGRRPGGVGRGVETGGFGELAKRSTATTSVRLPGSDRPCTDTVPVGDGGLLLEPRGTQVRVSYFPGTTLRSRCPGPALPVEDARGVASATVPLRAFARERVTLRLTRGRAFATEGFSLRTRPDLTVVLRRGRLVETG
jgi:hypothetical protein